MSAAAFIGIGRSRFGVLKSDDAQTRSVGTFDASKSRMNNFIVTEDEQLPDPLVAFGHLCDRAIQHLDCLRYERAGKRDTEGDPDRTT